MSYRFQFPKTMFVPKTNGARVSQGFKILEEAEETAAEVYKEGLAIREAEECMDTIVACETLLRSYPEKILQEAYGLVVSKNRNRGYWDEPDDLPAY